MNLKIIFVLSVLNQLITIEGVQFSVRGNSRPIATRYGGLSPRSMKLLRILLKRKLCEYSLKSRFDRITT